jgi:CRISPR system Cascade subunit CasA
MRRLSGAIEWASPGDLTDRIDEDPFVAVAWPRPDFDGAALEFLIGLLAAIAPGDEDGWLEWWESPPAPLELKRALGTLPPAFDLLDPAHGAFQDPDSAEFAKAEELRPEQLLLDGPGNDTLFTKEGRVGPLGLPSAAMALITLQTYAPTGGRGNRTSMRGGGPLTTLVDPRPARNQSQHPIDLSLWRLLWANTPSEAVWREQNLPLRPSEAALRYPWLAPTRVSREPGRATRPRDADALQCFFATPRRVRLTWSTEAGRCGLTGQPSPRLLVGYRQRPYGVQYDRWIHPLSPYYRTKPTEPWLAVHGGPSGVAWRDWVSFTLMTDDSARRPAQCVWWFQARRAAVTVTRAPLRLLVFGYDFDQMKAQSWVGGELPLYVLSPHRVNELHHIAKGLVEATSLAASLVHGAIARASSAADAGSDGPDTKQQLWDRLADSFFSEIAAVATLPDEVAPSLDHSIRFHAALRHAAVVLFDALCPTAETDPARLRRIVTQRSGLRASLNGLGPMGQKLLTSLGLAPRPRTRAARPSRHASTPKE